MRNYHNSIPTFGQYSTLINEKVTPEISGLNEYHYSNFYKRCLIENGFISVVRYVHDETIYLKLYYFEKKVRDNKREMEQFVSSFYLHESPQLNYSNCNILRILLKTDIEKDAILKQEDVAAVESLLQLQLNEDSWVGVDITGTSGGLTMGANRDFAIHQHRKSLLAEGYMKPDYTEKVNQYIPEQDSDKSYTYNKVFRESDGLLMNVSLYKIVLSWDAPPFEVQVSYSIKFKWKSTQFKLTVLEYYGQRSNTIKAIVEYLDKSYTFGFGRSSVGAGSIGETPDIRIGNEKLKFQFGKNTISITEVSTDNRLNSIQSITESNFELIV